MERENSKTDCRVVSLEVLDLDEENLFELPVVFTRPSLPITTESAANQQHVERWQCLSEVKIPNIDADVSLLIGSDAPEILEPKQVIPSQNGGHPWRPRGSQSRRDETSPWEHTFNGRVPEQIKF